MFPLKMLEQQVTLPEFRKTSDCLNNIFSEIKNDHIFDADCELAKNCVSDYIESCELPAFCCSDKNDSQSNFIPVSLNIRSVVNSKSLN